MKTQKSMKDMWKESYLSDGNDAYLEGLYESYLNAPETVSPEWRNYFNELSKSASDVSHAEVRNYFLQLAKQSGKQIIVQGDRDSQHERKQEKVIDLINAYRSLGHLQANIDPLGLYQGATNPTLDLSYYGFTETDLNTVFDVGSFKSIQKQSATLSEIHRTLRQVYCGSIGIEYMHNNRLEEVAWIQERMEQVWPFYSPSKEEKLRILDRLVVADGLEKYLGFK